MSLAAAPARRALLHRALRLEYLTVGWNLVEGAIAISAALVAGSVALLGLILVREGREAWSGEDHHD